MVIRSVPEAHVEVVHFSHVKQEFADLPEGVSLTPGHLHIEFDTPTEALEKLLALAMAIRNEELLFERLATKGGQQEWVGFSI
jgi:hypothetical protein